ncbi:MAG: hypothetical protein RLZZ455_1156 [Candidatus Parcubacteria bacterium]|jgi:proline iminopeptidase
MSNPEVSMVHRGRTGFVPVPGGEVFVNVVNEEIPRTPLLIVPGGPGYPEDFEPLRALDRPVVTYHQLGSGYSRFEGQEDSSHNHLWTLQRSIDELHAVIEGVGHRTVNLLGYSYGGMVVTEALLQQYRQNHLPEHVQSVIFASTPFSEQVVTDDLREMLGQDVVEMITQYENSGNTQSPEYQDAMREFTQKHILGLGFDPDTHESLRFSEATFGESVALAMVGHSEINPTGLLKGYNNLSSLSMIRGIPVLITCGRHDEVTPHSMQDALTNLPHAELVVFEESAHFAQWTEAEKYKTVVREFLSRVDTNVSS